MVFPIYDAYSGLIFLPTGSDCADYLAGKVVHLYRRKPEPYELDATNNLKGET